MDKGERGFSLAEVLIAISLLALLAAIAIPFFQGYARNTNLKSAARDIQADFFNLRARAVAENIMFRVTFDPPANSYRIEQGSDGGPPYTTVQVKTPAAFGQDIEIAEAAFNGGPSATFERRGIATNGMIILTNTRGSRATIVTTVSGRTYVDFRLQ